MHRIPDLCLFGSFAPTIQKMSHWPHMKPESPTCRGKRRLVPRWRLDSVSSTHKPGPATARRIAEYVTTSCAECSCLSILSDIGPRKTARKMNDSAETGEIVPVASSPRQAPFGKRWGHAPSIWLYELRSCQSPHSRVYQSLRFWRIFRRGS